MNRKKLYWITIILLCIAIATIIIILKIKENHEVITEETEITPVEEVTEEQERQTIIALYYTNKETRKVGRRRKNN